MLTWSPGRPGRLLMGAGAGLRSRPVGDRLDAGGRLRVAVVREGCSRGRLVHCCSPRCSRPGLTRQRSPGRSRCYSRRGGSAGHLRHPIRSSGWADDWVGEPDGEPNGWTWPPTSIGRVRTTDPISAGQATRWRTAATASECMTRRGSGVRVPYGPPHDQGISPGHRGFGHVPGAGGAKWIAGGTPVAPSNRSIREAATSTVGLTAWR